MSAPIANCVSHQLRTVTLVQEPGRCSQCGEWCEQLRNVPYALDHFWETEFNLCCPSCADLNSDNGPSPDDEQEAFERSIQQL